jgi:hypothetical protein
MDEETVLPSIFGQFLTLFSQYQLKPPSPSHDAKTSRVPPSPACGRGYEGLASLKARLAEVGEGSCNNTYAKETKKRAPNFGARSLYQVASLVFT